MTLFNKDIPHMTAIADADITTDNLLYMIDNPAGTPLDRKVTAGKLAEMSGKFGRPGTFYPQNYGALADGVADDTSAIQDCIDALIARGYGKIIFDGYFKCESELEVSYEATSELGNLVFDMQAARFYYTGSDYLWTVEDTLSPRAGGAKGRTVKFFGGKMIGTSAALGCFKITDVGNGRFVDIHCLNFDAGIAFHVRNWNFSSENNLFAYISNSDGFRCFQFDGADDTGGPGTSSSFARTKILNMFQAGGEYWIYINRDAAFYDSVISGVRGNMATVRVPGCIYCIGSMKGTVIEKIGIESSYDDFVSNIYVTDGGSGYLVAPDVTMPGGATAVAVLDGDAVDYITITDPADSYVAPPAVTITPVGADPGVGAAAEAFIGSYAVMFGRDPGTNNLPVMQNIRVNGGKLGAPVFNLRRPDNWMTAGDTTHRYGSIQVLPYSATIATDLRFGSICEIEVTDANAFEISNPTGYIDGDMLVYHIWNHSGGAMGVITWGGQFKIAGWTNPANGKRVTIMFYRNNTDANFYQIGAPSADL